MRYYHIEKAVFLERPNRFIAVVDRNGQREICHVKNTGRCRELLVPGARVYLEKSDNPARKTKYDLVCVKKGDTIVNMDSQIPNAAVREWIENGGLFREVTLVKPEAKYGSSRFDLYLEADGKKVFMEVKGVTLEEDGIARFPDAPTIRGIKHIQELVKCMEEGYEAYIFFVIQMKGVTAFEPNDRTHREFGETLRHAAKKGVHIMAYDCTVTEDSIAIDSEIEVRL